MVDRVPSAERQDGSGLQAGLAVEFDGVSLVFRRGGVSVSAVDKVNFRATPGSLTSIVGPSGCGKSTLLKLAAGTLPPTTGSVRVGGQTVRPFSRDVGFVAQHADLFPWLTLRGNVEFPLIVRGYRRATRLKMVAEIISLVGLEGFEEHYPYELSGGMQKRASIARTLIYDPGVIYMDEPFGALDALTKLRMQGELMQIWQRRPKTILFVTHDLTEAITLSDTVIILSRRPGTVRAVFDIPLPRPRDAYEIQAAPGFAAIYEQIWTTFRVDVLDRPEES